MAENNNNLQYVHPPNAKKGQKGKKAPGAPAGQAYYLPAISFQPNFSNNIARGQGINQSKTILHFAGYDAKLYETWRAAVKAQMSARGFTPQQGIPSADFREIVHGMRRLRPACDALVRADAGNNAGRILDIDVAIATLVKDCSVKLRASLLSHPEAQAAGGNAPAQIAIPPMLLPPNGPALWGVNTPPVPPGAAAVAKGVPGAKGNRRGDRNAEQPAAPEVDPPAQGGQEGDQAADEPAAPEVDPAAQGGQEGNQAAVEPAAPEGGENVAHEPVEARPPKRNVRKDWTALLGRPRAVRIAWVRPSRRYEGVPNNERVNLPDHPNYGQLNWRGNHISGVRFGELDSSDIHGLCAMILRWVPFHQIRYIIGTTGEGSRSLTRHPDVPLTQYEMIWIENDETLRTWLLSNPVLQDPLDLLIYGYRDQDDAAPDTPELWGHPYLEEHGVHDIGVDPDVQDDQIREQEQVPPGGAKAGAKHRAKHGQNNEMDQGDKPRDQRQHPEIVIASSLAGREANDSGDGEEINTSLSRDADAQSRAAEPARSSAQLPGTITRFQKKDRFCGLVLPPPAQNDGWMGSDSFNGENVHHEKPIPNLQQPVDLVSSPSYKIDERKRRALSDVENVPDAKRKRRPMVP